MAGTAAGGFVARSLDAMFYICTSLRKHPTLQEAIQDCLFDMKGIKQELVFEDSSESSLEEESADSDEANEEAKGPGREGEEVAIKPVETHESITAALAHAGHILEEKHVDLILKPLKLAFETHNLKLVELALDCLHKLIAYDHLEGDLGVEGGKNGALFTYTLKLVCTCVDNSSSESTILQVLKVLLTAMSSTKFRVHGEPLLRVIRVCYNIALNSKSTINQATSKAMLTQMISTVFRRMESVQVSVSTNSSFHADVPVASSNCDIGNISMDDQDESKTTLGDALTMAHAAKTSPSSVKEIHNLSGGTDIKGLEAVLDKAVQLEEGTKISRECLKGEIGVLFPLILTPLESFESPLSHITSVLRMLEKVCKDSQMLADIFVNYDCDLEAPNLFESMVNALSRMSQGPSVVDPNFLASSQTTSTKTASLQCLVSVLNSLVEWENLRRESEHSIIVRSLEEEVLAAEANTLKELKNREDGLSQFEKAKAHKSTLKAAIPEFNRKPSKGVEYLLSNNLVENTASSVAQFIKNTPTLDKAMIGEYLGQYEEFPLAVMHAYVESMRFAGLKFDTAIREFLKGFHLPGEAQKIDRIMEKFAERYFADNPGLFKNADTAYVLAFAVIILNTDAHNPMVWPKMSKSDFIHMNSVSDTEECVPMELLEEIYDSIVKEEIKMKDDTPNVVKSSRETTETEDRGRIVNILNLALPRRKSGVDTKAESEKIKKQIQDLFRKQAAKRGVFYTAQQVEIVRPMVEAVGWPLLATFSVTMEEGDNKHRILLCMEGFRAGIHITRFLGMDTMRYAFLTSLVRFTFLHAPKEMHTKNVEALRTLLFLCAIETDALQDTWNAVLECVSRLEYITSTPSIAVTVMLGSNQISRDSVVQSLRELAGKPAQQVFVNSRKLPSDTIVEFFTSLCGVSAEELKQTPPRVFSLKKLVEISYHNMARIRLVWARIWSVLAQHLITAGSHYDETIAMYAIDSLRQLGMKYLERAELTNFTFQNDILKPFVILMRNSANEKIRSLIIDCILQMIRSKSGSIKSGWRCIFMVFTAADNELESIVESAFENVEQVILEHFDQIVGVCFLDCVNCLIAFANNKRSARISLKAIALLRICENRLAEGLIPGGVLQPVDSGEGASVEFTEHYWFPMLAGLSDLTLDSRSEIRNCALEVLFDLLNERGQKFSSGFWERIFHRVLFPIFDHVRYAGRDGLNSSEDEWLHDNSIHSLQLLCNLFNTFYKDVSFMLPPLLGLLLDCAKKTDQTVVSISLGALVHLIEVGGHQFSDTDWDTLLKSIRDASYTTQPLELLNSLGLENSRNLAVVSNEMDTDKEDDSNGNNEGKAQDQATSSFNSETTGKNSKLINNEMEDLQSSSGIAEKPADVANLQKSQTFGQRIMGNMMDNLFIRSLTSKPKGQTDVILPSSPLKGPYAEEPFSDHDDTELSPMEEIRAKCMTQLLLLGAINSIQKRYWSILKSPQKIALLDILMSLLDFAASYNCSSNLRLRMHHIPSDRPPVNLLRQEITGTSIYLEVLQKTTASHDAEEKLENLAEDKLVTFCGQILKEASDLQPITADAATADVHRLLDLRAPIVVKVLKGMCSMNSQIFKKHLKEFYPLITKLVCCDQMDIRGALGELFNTQIISLLR